MSGLSPNIRTPYQPTSTTRRQQTFQPDTNRVYYDPINKNVVPKERVYNAHNRVPTQRAVNPHNRGNIEPHKFSDHEELFTNERHETFMLRQFDTGNPRQPIPASSIPQPPRRMDAYTLHPDHQFGRKRHEMLNPFGPQRGVRDQNTGALLGVISHPPLPPQPANDPKKKKGKPPKPAAAKHKPKASPKGALKSNAQQIKPQNSFYRIPLVEEKWATREVLPQGPRKRTETMPKPKKWLFF